MRFAILMAFFSTTLFARTLVQCRSSIFANGGLKTMLMDEGNDGYHFSLTDKYRKGDRFLSKLGLPLEERKIYTLNVTLPKTIPISNVCAFSRTPPAFTCG